MQDCLYGIIPLKEPNTGFVDSDDYQGDFPTQRISTLGVEENNRGSRNQGKENY